jgi:hypothetical protein
MRFQGAATRKREVHTGVGGTGVVALVRNGDGPLDTATAAPTVAALAWLGKPAGAVVRC